MRKNGKGEKCWKYGWCPRMDAVYTDGGQARRLSTSGKRYIFAGAAQKNRPVVPVER